MAKWKVTLDFTDYHGEEEQDIKNCLNTLYNTPEGTVALDREFGLNWDVVDLPIPVAINRLVIEITKKTERYEPRIAIKDIESDSGGENEEIKIKVVFMDG